METLLGLRMRYSRDQEELGLLHSQAVQLRDQEKDRTNGSGKRGSVGHAGRETWSPESRQAVLPVGHDSANNVPIPQGANRYGAVTSLPAPNATGQEPLARVGMSPHASQFEPLASLPPTGKSSAKPPKPTRPAVNGELYERLAHVGEGTYGKVYKARNVETGAFFALKRIRMEGEKDGFPVTAMREIKLLQNLKHPNVLRLAEMMVSKGESA